MIRAAVISVTVVLLAVLTGGFFVYRHLDGNITSLDVGGARGTDPPPQIVKDNHPPKTQNNQRLGS
ncbi:MAG: hypothetical protein ACTHOK_08305, partial [Nocardioidaceae bacterium]